MLWSSLRNYEFFLICCDLMILSEVLDHWSNCSCLDCSHRASKFDSYSGFPRSKSDLSASGWDLPTIKINVNTTWWRWSYKATNFDPWLQGNMITNTAHQVDFFEYGYLLEQDKTYFIQILRSAVSMLV